MEDPLMAKNGGEYGATSSGDPLTSSPDPLNDNNSDYGVGAGAGIDDDDGGGDDNDGSEVREGTPRRRRPPSADHFAGDGDFAPLSLSRHKRQHSFLRSESIKNPGSVALRKTQSSFWEDAREFREGSVPQSIVVALAVGVVCGVAAFIYYQILFFLLDYLWHVLPQKYVVGVWPENLEVLWIALIGFLMAVLVGLSVQVMGEPGDLAYTIKCVHDKAYISMSHVLPMVAASQFSILGGGSLGPEAPLVAICAALGGHMSRKVFKQKNRNVVRKHTLMGMAGALSAFFGCPLGGSLFALEVNSRFGIEYFEHMIEAIFCGEVCVAVFRALSGLPIDAIWTIQTPPLASASPFQLLVGAFIGLLGAGIAALFSAFHFKVMDIFDYFGLLDNRIAVARALLGSVVIVGLGMVVPHTMFWGEWEFQTVATMGPASELDHIWPTRGLFGFEMDTWGRCLIVAFTKLVAISFTVAGGYRGGFIFPFFAAGAAFGRAFTIWFPSVSVSLACLSFAAGINVAITRTSLATPLILCYLAGEQNAISGVLAASLVSLFATSYMPFIKTQIVRKDLDSSLFYLAEDEPLVHSSSEANLEQQKKQQEQADEEEHEVL